MRKSCFFLAFLFLAGVSGLALAEDAKSPITINGDHVEYSTDSSFVTAQGDVSIVMKETKLSCDKLTINTITKDVEAFGHIRLEDGKGVIEGKSLKYNFVEKTGIIMDAFFRANPFFGRAEKLDKINDEEFIAMRSYVTTCSYDIPHFRMKSKKVKFYPGNKVEIKDTLMTLGRDNQVPILYLPQFKQYFKDKFMRGQWMPGKSKEWGYYMLTAWRYNLNDYITGKLMFDYRSYRGFAEGFLSEYRTDDLGKGDLKLYYTQERDRSGGLGEGVDIPKVFQRYLVRWRHKWDIDRQSNFISQYYKIIDSKRAIHGSKYNFLKDYFPREYDKDSQPLSFAQYHRGFGYSSIDFLFQPRINRWTDQLEKKPQITYVMPANKIFGSPFYFESSDSFAEFRYKHAVPSPSTSDIKSNRFDFNNTVSYPTKIAFVYFSPNVGNRITYYNSDIYGSSIAPRTIFLTGATASTKFYRFFNLKTNLLWLDLNGLRHVITPTITYAYNHRPTLSSTRIKQIDGTDAIDTNNNMNFLLQNKLQTKRGGVSVDLVDFRIETNYNFLSVEPMTGIKNKGGLGNFKLNLDVLPYSWLSWRSNTTWSTRSKYFTNANTDLNLNFGKDHSTGMGMRYERKGGRELTFTTQWRLSPKWKISFYERYQFGKLSALNRGLREQQYVLSRDLHCWTVDLSYNEQRGKGNTIWVVFRLKAFPEMEFDYNKTYHEPKPGSQGYAY